MQRTAQSIDEVIERLTEIIEWSRSAESRTGYFAALYRKVTQTVKERIDEGGYFEDDARMERLDIIFATRYLDAFDQVQSGRAPTRSWAYAFEVADQWWPIVLQHLLIGMNAHINLDLGIAAFQTTGRDGLPGLRRDFNRINELLAGLVDGVKQELSWVWPPLRWLNNHLGNVESAVINFSMTKARDAAWSFANELAELPDTELARAISRRDREVRLLGEVVRHPGIITSGITKIVRLGERGSVAGIIQILE